MENETILREWLERTCGSWTRSTCGTITVYERPLVKLLQDNRDMKMRLTELLDTPPTPETDEE